MRTNIHNLPAHEYVVIDLDTGTVLGTNLVLVKYPATEEEQDRIMSSDSAAWGYGTRNGIDLTAEV